MCADPEPYKTFRSLNRNGALVLAHACRPERPCFFQMQRRMPGVLLQPVEASIRNVAHLFGQGVVALPEIRSGNVVHSDVQRPAFTCLIARSAIRSSLPAATSRSNCASQFSASNSANHPRNEAISAADNRSTSVFIFSMVFMPASYHFAPPVSSKPTGLRLTGGPGRACSPRGRPVEPLVLRRAARPRTSGASRSPVQDAARSDAILRRRVELSFDELRHEVQIPLSAAVFCPPIDRLDEPLQAKHECGEPRSPSFPVCADRPAQRQTPDSA